MRQLSYQEIKKDLDNLYNENISQNLNIDQHIGRCLYEYEQVIDPEEGRELEGFFFYLALAKQFMRVCGNENLASILSIKNSFLSTYGEYDGKLIETDLGNAATEIVSDYKEVKNFLFEI